MLSRKFVDVVIDDVEKLLMMIMKKFSRSLLMLMKITIREIFRQQKLEHEIFLGLSFWG
jgi:hypothetical protein